MRRSANSQRTTSSRRACLPAVAALASAAALAGCGAASPSPTASLGGGSGPTSSMGSGGATTSAGSPPSRAQLHRDLLRFAECMRGNGVPSFPDPAANGGVFPVHGGFNPASPAARSAHAKCQKLLPDGGAFGPGTQTHPSAHTLAHFRTVARCMRSHGVPQFPDPRTSVPSDAFGSGNAEVSNIEGVIFVFPAALAPVDQRSPAFTHAAAACDFPLHNH